MIPGMSESDGGLRAAIEHVDEELGRASSLDEATRARVAEALTELHAAVEGPSIPGDQHRDTLFELVEHFAEEHPALSTSLGRVIDILAKMGI
jgi:hypothetical protein